MTDEKRDEARQRFLDGLRGNDNQNSWAKMGYDAGVADTEARYEEAIKTLEGIRVHGTYHDATPTEIGDFNWRGYIQSMDSHVREIAGAALRAVRAGAAGAAREVAGDG